MEIRAQSKIDISGPKYYTLSDRVKVQVLERIHGAKAPDVSAFSFIHYPLVASDLRMLYRRECFLLPRKVLFCIFQPVAEEPKDASAFTRLTDVQYASIRGATGRTYFCNPYYVAAWSNIINDKFVGEFKSKYKCTFILRMTTQQNLNEITCGCTPEELKLFLMTVYPPQLRISEHNVAPILMSACKMESPGLMRRCANLILNPLAQLSAFAKLSLLDRCFLHELLGERLLFILQFYMFVCRSRHAKCTSAGAVPGDDTTTDVRLP